MIDLIIPFFILCLLVLSFAKQKNAYSSFCNGAKKGFELIIDIMPFIIAIMLMICLMQISGLTSLLIKIFAPILSVFGIPEELVNLICIRPFTNSGSVAILSDILSTYGPDSYIGKCACLIMSSTETVFFVSAIYFSQINVKKYFFVLAISLSLSFLAIVLSCNLCRFFV